jgi:hypothetical protein
VSATKAPASRSPRRGSEVRLRSRQVKVALTPEEFRLLDDVAVRSGRSFAQVLRDAFFDYSAWPAVRLAERQAATDGPEAAQERPS